MLGSMKEPTSTAELLKRDLAAHTPMMAQYRWVTLNAKENLVSRRQVIRSVPL